jgi:hypothetical protein
MSVSVFVILLRITKNNTIKLQAILISLIASKHFDDNDSYIYEIKNESEEVQDICNAMSLVHNKNKNSIYQEKEHIQDAEFYIKKLGISRIEDG